MKAHINRFEQDQTVIGFQVHPGAPAVIDRMVLTLHIASFTDGVTELPIELDSTRAHELGRILLGIAKQLTKKSPDATQGRSKETAADDT